MGLTGAASTHPERFPRFPYSDEEKDPKVTKAFAPNPHIAQAQPHDDLGCTVQPNLDEPVRIGREAWLRLTNNQTFSDWLLVGDALLVGRTEAMRTAHTNTPEGSRYNREYSAWLKANKFDGIDKSTRSRLLECLAHRPKIEAWLATLTTGERLKLNHPAVILRRWKRTVVKKPDDTAPPKLSSAAKLKESIVALEEENARMKREIERGGGDLWTPQDTPKDIARVIFQKISRSKARDVARELNRLAREVEKANAASATVEVHA